LGRVKFSLCCINIAAIGCGFIKRNLCNAQTLCRIINTHLHIENQAVPWRINLQRRQRQRGHNTEGEHEGQGGGKQQMFADHSVSLQRQNVV
jgi:hypothetical protein